MPKVFVITVFAVAVLANAASADAPIVDYHQHLLSPAGAALLNKEEPGAGYTPITADDRIAEMDAAGIERAVILSDAYFFDGPEAAAVGVDDPAAMRAENDW